jgi:hypothetical protein
MSDRGGGKAVGMVDAVVVEFCAAELGWQTGADEMHERQAGWMIKAVALCNKAASRATC